MTDLAHKQKRKDALEAGNTRSYKELQEAVGQPFEMNTSDARREIFIDMLIEWGVITEEQKLDFDIRFLEKVEESLNEFWKQYREQKAAPKLHLAKKPTKLVDGHGRPLT